MKLTCILMLLCLCIGLKAQDKIEHEYRVKSKKVPKPAREWLKETFLHTKKIKWFFEETSGKKSYEAKFIQKRNRYSVEFSVPGEIEDVEVERDLDQLSPDLQKALQAGFDAVPKFKLRRMQEQWTANPENLKDAILTQNWEQVTIHFEVEFMGELNGEHALWEGLFSTEGKLLQHRKIILRPTDNMDF